MRYGIRLTLVVGATILMGTACDSSSEPKTGDLRVSVTTGGGDLDLNGYLVKVDGVTRIVIGVNGVAVLPDLATGSHDVALSDVAPNCTPSASNPSTAMVQAGATTSIVFSIACVVTGVRITTTTTGLDVDADGYAVGVDGVPGGVVIANGSLDVTRLAAGSHAVTLSGLAANCSVSGGNARSVTVAAGEVVAVAFGVTCVAATGIIEVTAATSGIELDADGYAIRVDGGSPQSLGINGTVRFPGLGAGSHSVTFDGATGNCTVAGDNPRILAVSTGGVTRDTARTTFAVTCVSTTGSLRLATTTSGAQLDPDGYEVFVDEYCYPYYGYNYCYYAWSGTVGLNDAVTIPNLGVGDHIVLLSGIARNCTLAGANPRTVTVPPGATGDAAFAVTCVQTGSLQITLTTSGIDVDANGYHVTLDGAVIDTSTTIESNATATIANLVPGDYTVMIGGVTLNCDVTSANPVTVTAVSGGTATASFSVVCAAAMALAVAKDTLANRDIYVLKSNGDSVTRLTTALENDEAPTWSRDRTKIAFVSFRNGNAEIYAMNADGSNEVRLTNHSAYDYHPTWLADGAKIAFHSERDGNREIYVMNAADGAGVTRLTNEPASDSDPAWSPNGSKIAFTSTRDNPHGSIYLMNADGSGVLRLTDGGYGGDSDVAWSPDGTKLVFARIVACEYYYCERDLYVMNLDGSGVTRLTSGGDDHGDPAWSPHGAWIAFTSAPCSYYSGCLDWTTKVVRSDGTDVHDIPGGPGVFNPVWRP